MADISPNALLTFQKAQSQYLGLESPASQEELLMLDALYKRSRQSLPFKRDKSNSSNPLKRIAYNAWKTVEDEKMTPGAAKAKYYDMIFLLKEKYKLRKDEPRVLKVTYPNTITSTNTDTKPRTLRSGSPELNFRDAFTQPELAEDKLGDPTTTTSQSFSTTAIDQGSIPSDTSMPLIKISQLPDTPPLTPPLMASFNLFTSKHDPSSLVAPQGTYHNGTYFACEVCDARLVDTKCPNGHEPRECPDCGWEILDGAFKCRDCQSENSILTQAEKIQKLLAKVAEDRESFGTNCNTSDEDEVDENEFEGKDAVDGAVIAEEADTDIEIPDVAIFDPSDSVWRCTTCGWEIEADDEVSGRCRDGHLIDLELVPEYAPADSDSDGDEPMVMQWDSDDILEDSDGEDVVPGDEDDDFFIGETAFELQKVDKLNGLYVAIDEDGQEEIYEHLDEMEEEDLDDVEEEQDTGMN